MANLRARQLRRNLTPEERRLWVVLRRKQFAGFRFRRQQPLGQYIVDFFCPAAKLVIEVDSAHHAYEPHSENDAERDRWLAARGYRVLRIINQDLKRRPGDVSDAIYAMLADPPSAPSGHLPPQGGKDIGLG